MVRIDIGYNLEDESAELLFVRLHITLFRFRGTWRWCDFYKAVEEFLHTEVVQGRTEEDGCHFSRAVGFYFEVRKNAAD